MGRYNPSIFKPVIMDQETIDLVMSLKDWHKNKVDQLEMVKENQGAIKFESKNGDQIELPEEHVTGFKYGIEVALSVLGEFPIKITENENNQ